MKLRYAAGSPFVRKVTVTAIETGLDDRIERVETNYREPDSDFTRNNPLGRVPALLTDEGKPMIESSVICAYLDTLHGGPRLIPESGEARREALWLEALADGMTEAAVAVQRERGRPEDIYWKPFETSNWTKVERALDAVNAEPALLEAPLHIGQVALACGLGWILFRMPDKLAGWEERWPAVASWYAEFSRRPSMQATAPR